MPIRVRSLLFCAYKTEYGDCDDGNPAISPAPSPKATAPPPMTASTPTAERTQPSTRAAPAGHVANDADCDDGSATGSPDATEICDGEDNDCDALVEDENDTILAASHPKGQTEK